MTFINVGTNSVAGSYTAAESTTFSEGTTTFTGTVTGVGPTLTATGGAPGGTGTFNNAQAISTTTLTISSGRINFNNTGGASATTLGLSGGTLGGTQTLTVSGPTTWTGGTMTDAGTTTLNGALTLSSGTSNKDLTGGRTLNTTGTTTWIAGQIRTGGGATINNAALWQDQNTFANQIVYSLGGAVTTFNNTGTYRKSIGTGTTTIGNIGMAFNNTSSGVGTGVVDLQSGSLLLTGGGTANSGSTFTGAAGTTLGFGGGYTLLAGSSVSAANVTFNGVTMAGSYTATESTTFSGGTTTFTGTVSGVGPTLAAIGAIGTFNNAQAISTTTLTITGARINFNNTGGASATTLGLPINGTLGGTQTLTVAGATTWTSGTMTDAGTTTLNGTLTLSGTAVKDLTGGRTLNVNGTTTWTNASPANAGQIRTGGGVTINNAALWQDQNTFNTQITNFFGGAASTFANTGTYRKSVGTGTTTIGIAFNNTNTIPGTGVVDLQSGSLLLTGGGTANSGSTFTGAAGTTLGFGGGHTLQAGSSVNAAAVAFSSGTNTVAGSFDATTSTTFSGGTTTFTGTVTGVGPTLTATGGTGIFNNAQAISTTNLSISGGGINFNNTGGASATTLALSGSGTLGGTNNLTVSSDYVNANFGTGNSFDRRANVTGAGQILAAGGVANRQSLSGDLVGGPTTGNATLAFGNVHVGDTVTKNYQIGNDPAAGPSLRGAIQTAVNGGNITDARLSGVGVTASNFGPLAPAGSTGNLAVTFTATGAGALTGQQAHIRNNFENLNTQNLSITGAAFRLAAPNALGPIAFGNVHVGDVVQQALSLTNTAANDGFSEKLNASFGAVSDARITTSGAINLLAPGATNNTSMVVGLNTAAAGVVTGTVGVSFQSDGTGTSGLGTTALPGQTIDVMGTITAGVFRLAQPSAHTPEPVNLGNVRVGTVATQALTLSNLAPDDGFSEKLNASIGGATAGVTASGAFTLLAPGAPGNPLATDNTSLVVGLDTASAGAKSGTATITLASDGTGTSGLGLTSLGTQTVNVSGDVFRLANPALNTTTVNLAARVGDTSPMAAISITNSSPDAFTEGLNVTRGATPAGFGSSGSITNLTAGSTSPGAIQVALNTGAAGSFSGGQVLDFVSTGAGTTGAPDVSVGSGNVSLTGRVYTPAVAQQNTPSVNFGIVHVGDVVATQGVSVTNGAAVTGLNDVLLASFVSAGSPFTGSGNLSAGLGAQQTDLNSLQVGLNTGTAGIFNGTATFSAASHDADLTDVALSSLGVSLTGQVNNFAQDAFSFGSGAGIFSHTGLIFTLDFGTRSQGSGMLVSTLFAGNSALGPADLLDGIFEFRDLQDFAENGFDPFTDLAAGQNIGPLALSFDTASLGSFSDTIVLHGIGHNASGFSAPIGDIELIVRGTVIAPGPTVPEPSTFALMLAGMLVFAAMRIQKQLRSR